MLQSIRTAFVDHMPEVTWMDEQTRAKAIDKADAIIQKIGYPDILADAGKLDEYYEKVRLRERKPFIHSVMKVVLIFQVHIQSTRKRKLKIHTKINK